MRRFPVIFLLLCALACGTVRQPAQTPSQNGQDFGFAVVETGPVSLDSLLREGEPADTLFAAETAEDPAKAPKDRQDRPEKEKKKKKNRTEADKIIAYAETFLGTPYKYGAEGPKRFDCSAYTRYVFREFGYELPRSSAQQMKHARKVRSYEDLRRGDLVFFGARKNIRSVGHVGIVTDIDEENGSFSFIHCSVTNGVEIQRSDNSYFLMRYLGAGRILP